jgi:hypothetical protein
VWSAYMLVAQFALFTLIILVLDILDTDTHKIAYIWVDLLSCAYVDQRY